MVGIIAIARVAPWTWLDLLAMAIGSGGVVLLAGQRGLGEFDWPTLLLLLVRSSGQCIRHCGEEFLLAGPSFVEPVVSAGLIALLLAQSIRATDIAAMVLIILTILCSMLSGTHILQQVRQLA